VPVLGIAATAPLAAAAGSCSDTFAGGDVGDPRNGDLADNWSAGLPGATSYACIPAGISGQVSMGGGETMRGISVGDSGGLRLHNFAITLTDPTTPSVIVNLDIGSLATFTVDRGVTVTLTGSDGTVSLDGFGAAGIAGAGTVVVAKGATVGFAGGLQGSVTFKVAGGAHVSLHSGYFDEANHAQFLNYGSVTISKPPEKGFLDSFGTNSIGRVVNEKGATITDPAGAASFTFATPFINLGTVSVAKHQNLDFSGGGSGAAQTGHWHTVKGSTATFGGGTFDLRKAKLTGPGTFDFKLGTTRLSGQHLAHVKQCGITRGPFTVTKSWVSAACVSNGEAVMDNSAHKAKTKTTFDHGVRAKVGYGGFLIVSHHERLLNHGSLTDQSDICIAGGAQVTNSGKLIGLKAPNKTTSRAIHPNCGIAGAEGKLINAKGGLLWGRTATLVISTKFANHGHKRGKVQMLG
jgi:hypothetical protein